MGNVFELKQSIALSGLNIIKSLSQGYPPWAIPCQPFGLCLKERNVYPFNSMTLPLLGGMKGGLFLFFHPHPTSPVEGG